MISQNITRLVERDDARAALADCRVLAEAVRMHLDDRVLLNKDKTVVFRS